MQQDRPPLIEVNVLTHIFVNQQNINDLAANMCTICLEEFQKGEKCIRLPCQEPHYFHTNNEHCLGIKKWLPGIPEGSLTFVIQNAPRRRQFYWRCTWSTIASVFIIFLYSDCIYSNKIGCP